MPIDEDLLIAYVDGELDDQARARVDAALAEDASLRQRVEAHRRLRAKLSAAFDGALSEPPPERLTQAAAAPRTSAAVINLSERRMRWSAREWGAMAASIAAGLVLGVGVMGQPAPLIAADDGALLARGALERALDAQLASDEAGLVRIGLSFRDEGGGYCRTFDLIDAQTSGLACRRQEGWNVAMIAANPQSELRTASAPAAILDAVEARIVGAPFDAEAETQARAAGWRAITN